MAQYVYTMNRVSKIVPPKRQILKDISLSFFPGAKIGVLGLNMLVGYNGQLSLGHGALYALGAYVTAVLMEHGGFAWWATLPVSAAVCFGFGFLRGPAHRIGSGVRGNHPAKLPLALEDRPPEITGKR